MELPKTVKMYCSKCKTHTEHKLKLFKPAAIRSMSKGQRRHKRRFVQGYGGKHKFPIKPKKQTKKPTFLAECAKCHKKCYKVVPKRMKKVELAAKE